MKRLHEYCTGKLHVSYQSSCFFSTAIFLPSSAYVYAIQGYKIFQFSSKNILQSIFFKSYLKVQTIINVNQWNIPRSNLNFPSSILNSGSYIMYNFIKILPKKQCPTKFNKWTITRKNYPNLKRGICSLINLLQQPSP